MTFHCPVRCMCLLHSLCLCAFWTNRVIYIFYSLKTTANTKVTKEKAEQIDT